VGARRGARGGVFRCGARGSVRDQGSPAKAKRFLFFFFGENWKHTSGLIFFLWLLLINHLQISVSVALPAEEQSS
jgi:hypothetical protein